MLRKTSCDVLFLLNHWQNYSFYLKLARKMTKILFK